MSPAATKPKFTIFSYIIKVTVKVKRRWTLVSFERFHYLSMHAKYVVSITYSSKVKANVKDFCFRQTVGHTNRHKDGQGKTTSRCRRITFRGHTFIEGPTGKHIFSYPRQVCPCVLLKFRCLYPTGCLQLPRCGQNGSDDHFVTS